MKIHDARVLIFREDKPKFDRMLKVKPESDCKSIELIGDVQFCREYYPKYTAGIHQMACIKGILIIWASDREKNPIQIVLTDV